MPDFIVERNGKKYTVKGAPDLATAKQALDQSLGNLSAPGAGQLEKAMEPYQPSMVPWLDPINAFASKFVDSIPLVGPSLNKLGNQVDASLASMIEGKPVTPEERAAINQADQNRFPIAAVTGAVSGPLAAYGLAGSYIPGAATVLGMQGSPVTQSLMGGLSGAGLAYGDATIRGKSQPEVISDAMWGGGLGVVAPWLFGAAKAGYEAIPGVKSATAPAKLNRMLANDGIKVSEIPARLKEIGPDAMVVDLGPNIQQGGQGLASVPGYAQRLLDATLNARSSNKAKLGRINEDVAATVGSSPDIDMLKQQIIQRQRQVAGPIYDSIRDTPIPALEGGFGFEFTKPIGKQVLEQAIQMAANDGVRFNSTGLTLGVLDYAKRAADDIAKSAFRNGNDNFGRQAAQFARTIASEADKIVPDYAKARAAFAGEAKVADAVDEGMTLFTAEMTPQQLARRLKDASDSEKDALLSGAQAWLERRLGNSSNDPVTLRNEFRKPWNEQKLRLLLGRDVADDLLKRIDREMLYAASHQKVLEGTQTARRIAGQQEINPPTRDLSQTTILGAVMTGLNTARNKLIGAGRDNVNRQLGGFMTMKQDDMNREFLQMLEQTGRRPKGLLSPAGVYPSISPFVNQGQGGQQ
jgi:hypothetical protein